MKDILIVVPTYNTPEKFMNPFMNKLLKEFDNILIVDDGSNDECKKILNKYEKKGAKVVRHYENFGKGRAIKTAFNYILNEFPNIVGCVTCDSDGQHTIKDIKKVCEEVKNEPDKLILGVRSFDEDNVPKKSKIGNVITKTIFNTLIGLKISDTQTGLRGFSIDMMRKFIKTEGERYEYETNMLIECQEKDILIKEVPIETVYIDNNSMTHFNPIDDSIKIYRLFCKYFLILLSTFVLDLVLFKCFYKIININSVILASTVLARILSSLYNYLLNNNILFNKMKPKILIKYYLIEIIQMFMSGCFVTYLFMLLNSNVILIKIIVDIIIFFVNILIRKEIINGEDNEK